MVFLVESKSGPRGFLIRGTCWPFSISGRHLTSFPPWPPSISECAYPSLSNFHGLYPLLIFYKSGACIDQKRGRTQLQEDIFNGCNIVLRFMHSTLRLKSITSHDVWSLLFRAFLPIQPFFSIQDSPVQSKSSPKYSNWSFSLESFIVILFASLYLFYCLIFLLRF